MTEMTKNGISTTTDLGQEQFEHYTSRVGRKPQKRISYDYRAHDGELFSCDCPTIEQCRQKRDLWLAGKAARQAQLEAIAATLRETGDLRA